MTLPDSTQAYVEPVVMVAAGSDILLAGRPSYVWRKSQPHSKLESRNQLFGVVLSPDGSARAVPRPAGFALAAVAATALDDKGWGVIFAELDSSKLSPDDLGVADLNLGLSLGVAALWYGHYDGTHWRSVERLPLPDGVSPALWGASRIVEHSDSLGWALPVSAKTGPSTKLDFPLTTLFFQRTGGEWSVEFLPAQSVATALGYSASQGWVVALVHTDRSLRRDENSLFFYTRLNGWQRARKVVAGLGQPVYHPRLEFSHGSGSVTWWTTVRGPDGTGSNEARTMVGSIDKHNEPIRTVDPSIVNGGVVALTLQNGERIWLTIHSTGPELRLSQLTRDGTRTFWRTGWTDDGGLNAINLSDSLVFVAKARLDRTHENLTTEIFRLRVDCRT